MDDSAEESALGGCTHALARGERMEALHDQEGERVPSPEETDGPVIDAHVHLFPEAVLSAIWRWFESHLWPVRYRLSAEQAIEFMHARGVSRMVALHYAHKPGMARSLNRFVAELARAHRDFVIPLGTVLPGETDAREIVHEALGPLGMHGIKVHCHVQKLAADDPRLDDVYAACQDAQKPVVIHAGREPCSPHYGVDTHALCHVTRMQRVLERYPKLTIVVPHLGADEFVGYAALLDRHEHLYLDTTMVVAGFFPFDAPWEVVVRHADRLLYGTDFPQLPFAWDRELRRLIARIPRASRRALFSRNAERVFAM